MTFLSLAFLLFAIQKGVSQFSKHFHSASMERLHRLSPDTTTTITRRVLRPAASSSCITAVSARNNRGSVLHVYRSTMCAKEWNDPAASHPTVAKSLVLQRKTHYGLFWPTFGLHVVIVHPVNPAYAQDVRAPLPFRYTIAATIAVHDFRFMSPSTVIVAAIVNRSHFPPSYRINMQSP